MFDAAQRIHRHPRTERATFAASAVARRRCGDEFFVGRLLLHFVQDAQIGRHDEFFFRTRYGGFEQFAGRADHIAQFNNALRRFGMNQHHRVGVFRLQRRQLLPFKFVMDDARTLPQQHIRARFAADVVAEVAVGPPNQFLAARFQIRHDFQRHRRRYHPVGTRFHGGGSVGVHYHRTVGVLVAKRRKRLFRTTQIQRTFRFQIRHQHRFFRAEDFRALAHEAHARHHQCIGFVFRTETRHLQRIAHASACFQSQILNQRIDVIMRHQDRVFLLQQGLDFVFQTTCRLAVGRVGNLRPRLTDLAGGSRRLDEGHIVVERAAGGGLHDVSL